MQVGVFSATLPPEALEITRKFMNKPVSPLLLVTHCSNRCFADNAIRHVVITTDICIEHHHEHHQDVKVVICTAMSMMQI